MDHGSGYRPFTAVKELRFLGRSLAADGKHGISLVAVVNRMVCGGKDNNQTWLKAY